MNTGPGGGSTGAPSTSSPCKRPRGRPRSAVHALSASSPFSASGAQIPIITRDDDAASALHEARSGGCVHRGEPSGVDSGASDPDRWSLSNRFSNLSASFLGGSEARSTPSAMNPAGGPAGTAGTNPKRVAKGSDDDDDATPPPPPNGDLDLDLASAPRVSSALNAPALVNFSFVSTFESSSDVA